MHIHTKTTANVLSKGLCCMCERGFEMTPNSSAGEDPQITKRFFGNVGYWSKPKLCL